MPIRVSGYPKTGHGDYYRTCIYLLCTNIPVGSERWQETTKKHSSFVFQSLSPFHACKLLGDKTHQADDSTAMANNSELSNSRAISFPPGVHVPSLTFFQDDPRQEIDWTTQERHLDFLISSGVHGSK